MDNKDILTNEELNKVEEKNSKNVIEGATNTIKAVGKMAKFSSFILRNIPLVAVVAGIIVISSFLAINPFNWELGKIFGGELKIDKTATIVEEIRKISEFTTANYFEEYVLQEQKLVEKKKRNKSNEKSSYDEIVLTVNGKIRAGFDLSKVKDNDIKVNGDTISIKLPSPEILDVISNPSDYSIFEESGDWQHDEIAAIQSRGTKKMLNNAYKHNILEKANNNGKDRITNLLTAFGFKVVNVTLSEVPVVEIIEEEQPLDEEIIPETLQPVDSVLVDSI